MTRRTLRPLLALALVTPASLVLVGVTATPASAATSFGGPTPSNGAVLSANSFTVEANVTAGSDSATLKVVGTDASGATLCTASKSSQGGPFSNAQRLTLSFPSSATCSTTRNARWTATLTGASTRTFSTNAAPATPSSFTAQGSGAREVSFTWAKGGEPDLLGYALYDEAGTLIDTVDLGACSGGTCAYGLYYPSDNPGTYSYGLAARRASAGCDTCGSAVESSRASASATLVEPPKPTPTPTPTPTSEGGSTGGSAGGSTGGTTGGTTGGSTGGTTGGTSGGAPGGTTGGTGGSSSGGTSVTPATKPPLPRLDTAAIQRRAFALNFNAFAPSLRIPKLPPLPAAFPPALGPQLPPPLPLGTYKPQLPYQAKTETVKETTVLAKVADRVPFLEPQRIAPFLAMSLILLLIAAHLRRFLGSKDEF